MSALRSDAENEGSLTALGVGLTICAPLVSFFSLFLISRVSSLSLASMQYSTIPGLAATIYMGYCSFPSFSPMG